MEPDVLQLPRRFNMEGDHFWVDAQEKGKDVSPQTLVRERSRSVTCDRQRVR